MADFIFAHMEMDDAARSFKTAKKSLEQAISYLPKDGLDLPLFDAIVMANEAIKAIEDTQKEARARVYQNIKV